MQKIITCTLVLFVSLITFGQQQFIFLQKDTINYQTRAGGSRIDSLDLYLVGAQMLTPGGLTYHPFGLLQNKYTDIVDYVQSPFVQQQRLNHHYSALPHLSFLYSFGSKGIQFLNVGYQQQLGKKTGFSLLLKQDALGDNMRHGNFTNREVQAVVLHEGLRYKGSYDLWYQSSTISYNNGLVDSVSANEFPVQLLAVNNQEAFSKINQIKIGSEHILNLASDSSKTIGPIYRLAWSASNREFRDSIAMQDKYTNFYIDSLRTRDQFQLASLENALGFLYKTTLFSTELLLHHRYWDYQNLAQHRDTNELSMHVNTSYVKGGWLLRNEAALNLQGARGEWSERLRLHWNKGHHTFAFKLELVAALPQPYLRNYRSNSTVWTLQNLKIQQRHKLQLNWQLKNKFSPSVGVNLQQYTGSYLFMGNTWTTDSLRQITLMNLQAGIRIPLKSFGIQLRAYLNPLAGDFDYIPYYDLRARLYFNRKLFKAKKFDFLCGVELKYLGKHRLMTYNPVLGTYLLNSYEINRYKVDFGSVDFFLGFQIDEFRFYFKLEHLDYSWINHDIQQVVSYPISPTTIRVGITWDFFN